jgi:predicted nucleic acid-binding protein
VPPVHGDSSTVLDLSRDVLLDTGPLVALYALNDRHHAAAERWLAGFSGRFHTVEAVLAEAAHLLPAHLCGALAELAAQARVIVHPVGANTYRRMAVLAQKYADRQPDWADLALVCLAETTGIRRIATLDAADFGVYRIHGRRAFDIVWPPGAA